MNLTAIIAPFALVAALTAQTTVVVPCNADNTLYQDLSGSKSNGAGTSVFVGENAVGLARRAVLRFDVASTVPAGATIVSAQLQMNVTLTQDLLPLPVDAHRITASWGEGNSTPSGVGGAGGGGGGTPQANDATWIHRFYTGTLWSTPGGDFVPTPSFSFGMPIAGMFLVPTSPGLVADVTAWRNNPATNFGWLLKANSETTSYTARRLDSRQSPTIVNRPVLIVTYLLPGQTSAWGVGCPSGPVTFQFAFSGAMIGGQSVFLTNSNGPPNAIAANFFALELNPPGVELYPSCRAYLPPAGGWIAGNVLVLDVNGAGISSWPVPTGYPGLFFMSQSLALDSNAPFGLVLSNAGVAVIQ